MIGVIVLPAVGVVIEHRVRGQGIFHEGLGTPAVLPDDQLGFGGHIVPDPFHVYAVFVGFSLHAHAAVAGFLSQVFFAGAEILQVIFFVVDIGHLMQDIAVVEAHAVLTDQVAAGEIAHLAAQIVFSRGRLVPGLGGGGKAGGYQQRAHQSLFIDDIQLLGHLVDQQAVFRAGSEGAQAAGFHIALHQGCGLAVARAFARVAVRLSIAGIVGFHSGPAVVQGFQHVNALGLAGDQADGLGFRVRSGPQLIGLALGLFSGPLHDGHGGDHHLPDGFPVIVAHFHAPEIAGHGLLGLGGGSDGGLGLGSGGGRQGDGQLIGIAGDAVFVRDSNGEGIVTADIDMNAFDPHRVAAFRHGNGQNGLRAALGRDQQSVEQAAFAAGHVQREGDVLTAAHGSARADQDGGRRRAYREWMGDGLISGTRLESICSLGERFSVGEAIVDHGDRRLGDENMIP